MKPVHTNKYFLRGLAAIKNIVIGAISMTLSIFSVTTHAVSLDDISFAPLSGNRVQIKMDLSEPLSVEPLNFAIDNPARIALDFPNVTLNLADKNQSIGIGAAHSVVAVESSDRTRVVLNLVQSVLYEVELRDSSVLVILASDAGSSSAQTDLRKGSIEDIDFRRGEVGEGKIIIRLSEVSTAVNMSQDGEQIIVDFLGVQLPEDLDRNLDVTDFATPVKNIDTSADGNNVRMMISTVTEQYDHLAYQTDKFYTLEFKPVTKDELEKQKKEKFGYTGERLSLNFQDIEVRAVLQLIADFTGFNLVSTDAVSGNVTLRLKNVPWDQALDIILTSRGLAKRQNGNVLLVAPQEEIAARERLELEAAQQIEELAPLRTEFIQINYADAADMATLIQQSGAGEASNLLSDHGTVTIDNRTNILIVQDIATSLATIRALVAELDIPIRQVLIESRIVNASETFAKDIGVRFGASRNTLYGNNTVVIGGTTAGNRTGLGGEDAQEGFVTEDTADLIVNLPAPTGSPSIGLAIGKVGSRLLQLELSALIAEGRTEEIASPRVITANQNEAIIEQGVQIPFQEATSSGATSISFQDATLMLRVTPQITPDDRVLLDLDVNQNSVGSPAVLGVPPINVRAVSTQVLVNNGETVVLGGVYTVDDRTTINRVPFFSDLPYVGFLFRRDDIDNEKRELLIFVTPKILKDGLTI